MGHGTVDFRIAYILVRKDVWKPGSLHKNLGHLCGMRQVYTGCHRILGSWDVPDMRRMQNERMVLVCGNGNRSVEQAGTVKNGVSVSISERVQNVYHFIEVNNMSLDKSIQSGKEYRKQYTGAKVVDATCRNHGSCRRCCGNRTHKNDKRRNAMEQQLNEHLGE